MITAHSIAQYLAINRQRSNSKAHQDPNTNTITYIQDLVHRKLLSVEGIAGKENPVDVFTKLVPMSEYIEGLGDSIVVGLECRLDGSEQGRV